MYWGGRVFRKAPKQGVPYPKAWLYALLVVSEWRTAQHHPNTLQAREHQDHFLQLRHRVRNQAAEAQPKPPREQKELQAVRDARDAGPEEDDGLHHLRRLLPGLGTALGIRRWAHWRRHRDGVD